MTLVRAQWSKTRLYEGEIEVDGFDPEYPQLGQIRSAIGELEDLEHFEVAEDQSEITEFSIIREGDEPHDIPAAPTHAADF